MTDHPAAPTGAQREKLHALPYDLVPFQEITEAYARVAEFGARKYAPWNWSRGLARVQILGSLLRHAFAYLRGEDRDRDSGLLHTDHILWNAAALVHNVHWDLEDGRRTEPAREYKNIRHGVPQSPASLDPAAPRILAEPAPGLPGSPVTTESDPDCCCGKDRCTYDPDAGLGCAS